MSAAHPEEYAQYRTGKTKPLIFFVGLARRLSGSKVDPRRAQPGATARADGGDG